MGNCCEYLLRKNTSMDTSSFLEDYDFEVTQGFKYDQPTTTGATTRRPTLKLTRKNTSTIYVEENQNKKHSIDDFEPFKLLGKGSFGKVMLVEQKTTGILIFIFFFF